MPCYYTCSNCRGFQPFHAGILALVVVVSSHENIIFLQKPRSQCAEMGTQSDSGEYDSDGQHHTKSSGSFRLAGHQITPCPVHRARHRGRRWVSERERDSLCQQRCPPCRPFRHGMNALQTSMQDSHSRKLEGKNVGDKMVVKLMMLVSAVLYRKQLFWRVSFRQYWPIKLSFLL